MKTTKNKNPNIIYHLLLPVINSPPVIWKELKTLCWTNAKSNEFQEKLNTFLDFDFTEDPDGINNCLSECEDLVINAPKRSCKIKKKKHRKLTNITNEKWFNSERRIQRHQLRKLTNQKQRWTLIIYQFRKCKYPVISLHGPYSQYCSLFLISCMLNSISHTISFLLLQII